MGFFLLVFLIFSFTPQIDAGTPWLRLPVEPSRLLLAPGGRYLAFVEGESSQKLKILNLENRKIWSVAPLGKSPSLLWSPDGYRMFYRTLRRQGKSVSSHLQAWDGVLHKSVDLESFPHKTGHLSFDPATWKIYLPFLNGVHSRQLKIKGLAPGMDKFKGSYVVTPKGVLWVNAAQRTKYLNEKKGKTRLIQSFDVCPQGRCIVWSTHAEEIYLSQDGGDPKQIGWGADPKWSPDGRFIAFSGSRRIGMKTYQYDLRVVDLKGQGTWLTKTSDANERWPQWESHTSLIHAVEKSTDIYRFGLPVSRFFSRVRSSKVKPM
ncbi:MAG: hypothetical protein AB8C84_09105 [Oligoflexales bacterium]